MTIEQYGHGPHGVQIAYDDFIGTYRFRTLKEAQEFKKKNGGRHFDASEDEPLQSLVELGRAASIR
jgi:hypothetical protein